MTRKEIREVEYEAIKGIKSIKQYVFDQEWNAALNITIEALEKQISKKPIDELSTHAIYDSDGNYVDNIYITIFKCPNCNNILSSGEINKIDCVNIHYCDNCGQAIDWSESE